MILRFFYIRVFLSFKFTQQTSPPITIKLENCFITLEYSLMLPLCSQALLTLWSQQPLLSSCTFARYHVNGITWCVAFESFFFHSAGCI